MHISIIAGFDFSGELRDEFVQPFRYACPLNL